MKMGNNEANRIVGESILKVLELTTGTKDLDFLRGYAEGLMAQREEKHDNMEKAG